LAPLATLSREQAGALEEIVVARLSEQKERLAGYSTQARFAMAQLHDQARPAQERDDAAR